MSDSGVRVVIDSSVAVKWLVAEREANVTDALRLLRQHADGLVALCAPTHIVLEVLNAAHHRGLAAPEMSDAARFLLKARLRLTPVEDLAERAAEIAAGHGLTVYDAAFVALAETLDCELVTADRRLASCTVCRTRLLGS